MENLKWEALKWKDGSRYDGQAKRERCHGVGVMQHSNGDRYEGEFHNGAMDGVGVYVWKGGTLYRGQWHGDQMEGCGVRMSRQAGGEFLIQEGQFVGDHFLGTFMDCSVTEARHAAAEADVVAARAGLFKIVGETENDSKDHVLAEEDETNRKRSSWFDAFVGNFKRD